MKQNNKSENEIENSKKEIKNRFKKIEERLDKLIEKLIEKKLGKKCFELLSLFQSKPRWAFNIKEVVKAGFPNAYAQLRRLMDMGIIERKWAQIEYKYYLVSEWNKIQ